MKQAQDNGFSLRLTDGRTLVLSKGVSLSEKDLPGSRSAQRGGPVAVVKQHPTETNIIGLQNLSQLPWRVRFSNGSVLEVQPGKNVRLTAGMRIHFGGSEGEAEVCAHSGIPAVSSTAVPRAKRGSRSKARLWTALVGAGLVAVASAGWFLYRHYSTVPEARNSPPKTITTQQKQTPVVKMPAEIGPPTADDDALSSRGVYSLQVFIPFDCLDGAVVDPVTGGISLFGHRTNPDRLLHIPYFDYLATALECRKPSFSLEWTTASFPLVDKAMTSEHTILDAVANIFDDQGKLKAAATWYLQELGVPVTQGMDQLETLTWMLHAANHPKTAEVVRCYWVWRNSKENASGAQLALYKTLGIEAVYQDAETKLETGAFTEDQYKDFFYPQFFTALGNALEYGNRLADNYRRSRANGRSPSDAFKDSETHSALSELASRTRDALEKKKPEIQVPASILTEVTGGVVPKVYPIFTDLPASSMLSRIAFEADWVAKYLDCTPQLKSVIPKYRTQFEVDLSKGRIFNHRERVWLAPGKFVLSQSPDGKLVRFSSASMTINVRKIETDKNNPHIHRDLPDPEAEEYGAELTSQYDALSQVFPVLQKLREAEKIVALARWLEKRGIRVPLPQEGRQEWSPPAEIPGFIHSSLSSEKSGHMVECTGAEGGVDLNVDPTITNDPTLRDAVVDNRSETQIVVPTDPEARRAYDKELRAALADPNITPEEKAALEVRLAYLLKSKGKLLEAQDEWEKAWKINPVAAEKAKQEYLAAVQQETDAPKQALIKKEKSLRTAIDSPAITPEQKAALEVQLSHVLAQKGDALGASNAWKQARKDSPVAAENTEKYLATHPAYITGTTGGLPLVPFSGSSQTGDTSGMQLLGNTDFSDYHINTFIPNKTFQKLGVPQNIQDAMKADPNKFPELRNKLNENNRLSAIANNPDTTQPVRDEARKKLDKNTNETKEMVKKIEKENFPDAPSLESDSSAEPAPSAQPAVSVSS